MAESEDKEKPVKEECETEKVPFTERISFLVTLCLIIISIQIFTGILIYFSFDKWSARGTFGDMFGAVNSLFSGLALAGIVYAIFLQRRDLKIQRDDLELTRKELERSADAQEYSTQILKRQLEVMSQEYEFMINKEEKESEPFFISEGGQIGREKGINNVRVINTGARITKIETEKISDLIVTFPKIEYLATGGMINFVFKYPPRTTDPLPFRIRYENRLGKNDQKDLLFYPVTNKIEIVS